jgi:hypothetical protein
LQEAVGVTKDSGQPVNDGGGAQGHTDHIGTYDEIKVQTKDQLARQAEIVIDRAKKSLDNISGSIEATENLNSYYGPDRPDASKILNNLSPQTDPERGNSRTQTDNLANENHPHTVQTQENKASSHTGKSDIRSAHPAIISEDSHSVKKTDPKADAGHNQKVIEGTKVTLDGTESKLQSEYRGLSYSWEQTNGPKVRILGAKSAVASFEAPKVPSGRDELALKFVLLVTDDSDSNKRNSNNDKDSVIVIVKGGTLLDRRGDHESSTHQSSPDNKARSSTHAEDKSPKDINDSNGSVNNDSNSANDTKNEKSIKSPEVDMTNTNNDLANDGDTNS